MKEKIIALVSGGIDSPAAAYLLMRKGAEVVPLFLNNYPYSFEDNWERARKVIKKLQAFGGGDAYVVDHGQNLTAFMKVCPRKNLCLFCRRMMFRIAEKLAEHEGAEAICTGEFLGSKASQTLVNLGVVSQATCLPVLRPLLGLTKEEIEKIGRKAGTFELSAEPAMCCTAVPESPRTKSSVQEMEELEKRLDIGELVADSMKTLRKWDVSP